MKHLNNIVLAALLVGTSLSHRAKLDPKLLAKDIGSQEIDKHVQRFNTIAKTNDGNRAFGTSGYKASMDHVLRVVRQCGSAMDVSVQPFTHAFTNAIFFLTGPDGKAVPILAKLFNRDKLPRGQLTAPLVDVPVDDRRGSGCFQDQWDRVNASAKIALIQRGGCRLSNKINLAKQNGALAVVIYNQAPGEAGPTPGSDDVGKRIPSGFITLGVGLEIGQAWRERLSTGQELEVALGVRQAKEQRTTWNIIAESAIGEKDNVVMLGAHLDSVGSGPGINDNGSGSAGLLAIVSALCRYTGYNNKVRFAWWGAEELGLIGSNYYVSKLSEAEADRIRFYFNYDMIGSLRPNWTVYANTDADRFGAERLYSFLTDSNVTASYRKFGSSSDYVGFRKIGIPSSGVFTGAGEPADACYHQACDDRQNINIDAAVLATKAAASALGELALSLEGLPAREKKGAPAAGDA